MTARELSPAEAAEAARFGIQDEDAIAGLESHMGDSPQCSRGGHSAEARMITRCCGVQALGCMRHIEEHLMYLAKVLTSGRVVQCVGCGREFRAPAASYDVVRVVKL